MNWGRKEPDGPPPEDPERSRFAAPPPCPRCSVTKAQMNRTIQNYQKAYRKKVEGLKVELSSVRADNQQLRVQVRHLKRRQLVHVPSLLLGGLLGVTAAKHLLGLLQRLRRQVTAAADSSSAPVPAPSADGTAAPATAEAAATQA